MHACCYVCPARFHALTAPNQGSADIFVQERPATPILTVSIGLPITPVRQVFNGDPQNRKLKFCLSPRTIRMQKNCFNYECCDFIDVFCCSSAAFEKIAVISRLDVV